MSNKLQSLTIRNLRGATSETCLRFAKDKKITMIFGENGTGKSTIVDAFSMLCEQSVFKRNGTRIEHSIALGKSKEDVSVELKTDNGVWTARLEGSTPIITPESNSPSLRVLRRSNVLQLVEADAAERFKALKTFLSLSGIVRCTEVSGVVILLVC